MTMHLMDAPLADLNAQRTATDTLFAAAVTAMPWWLSMLHGPAQELAFWATVVVALGRLILFCLDVRHRFRDRGKAFPGERFDHGAGAGEVSRQPPPRVGPPPPPPVIMG